MVLNAFLIINAHLSFCFEKTGNFYVSWQFKVDPHFRHGQSLMCITTTDHLHQLYYASKIETVQPLPMPPKKHKNQKNWWNKRGGSY